MNDIVENGLYAEIDRLRARVQELEAERDAAVKWLEEYKSKTYCAYCGAIFNIDSDASHVSEHIRTCPHHPMRELAAENKRLAALNDMFPQEIARLEDRVSAEYEAERADDRARIKELEAENERLRELVDGARVIVEVFQWSTPAQERWREEWLKKAAKAMKEASHEGRQQEVVRAAAKGGSLMEIGPKSIVAMKRTAENQIDMHAEKMDNNLSKYHNPLRPEVHGIDVKNDESYCGLGMENEWTKRIKELTESRDHWKREWSLLNAGLNMAEDRIKELAAENKRLVALNDTFPQEIARLEDRVSAEYEAERADDRAKIEELKKENRRLREALKGLLQEAIVLTDDYLSMFETYHDTHVIQGWDKARWVRVSQAARDAREALKEASHD